MSENSPSATTKKTYAENIWTNTEGKIDGYTFKGKRLFSKALVGLKNIMKKGQPNEINNVTFMALDTRIQGAGLEIDVEVSNTRNRGNAVLKIYGPKQDIKKDNTVTVSKSKGSESKFVVILAEKIIIPLMDRFLSGEMEILEILDSKSDLNTLGSGFEPKKFKCSFCEKTCKSAAGLKSHTTRMHLEVQKNDEKDQHTEIVNHKRKASEEVIDVVESLLTEVVNRDVDDMLEEIVEDDKEVRRYTKMCNSCDFKVEAERKYISMQKILQHRDMCSFRLSCPQCDKTFKEQRILKRHMRDEHRITTCSTSPPLKKKKIDFKTNINHDIEEEEMDIDINDSDDEVLKKRSDMMDKKVIAKQKKNDEDVHDFMKQKAERKIKEEESIKERKRQQSKSKKLKTKTNKKQNQNLIPNIREVPESYRYLFNDDDVVYKVPGDGACGPNSASAHLFEDEVFGPKLRRNINLFWANHFYRKYQYITPCTQDTPFKRNINGKIFEFTDPEVLIEFLKTSDEAQYMWSDSEDLAILADMYQLRIKVVTTNREKPTVNWIYPDKNLAEYAELKDVEISDMILLHEDENHFDLVVSRNSKLATQGSLSYRHNIGPTIWNNIEKDNNEGKDVINAENYKEESKNLKDSDNISEIDAIKNELKACIEGKKKLEKNYYECEQELRNKTEEVEKLKVEIKDLKQIVDLEKSLTDKNTETHTEQNLLNCLKCGYKTKTKVQIDVHMKDKHEDKPFNCEDCQFQANTKAQLNTHMDAQHTEKQFNCSECPFQGTTQIQLNKHTNLKHRTEGQRMEEVIKCKHCGEQFSEIWNLMSHRKQAHRNTVAFCQNKDDGKCKYTSETCWWLHERDNVVQSTSRVDCFICSKTFGSKGEMMIHRKRNHRSVVRECMNFKQNKCRYLEQFCWFKHEDEIVEIEESPVESVNKTEENEDTSVFRIVKEDLEPPIRAQEK